MTARDGGRSFADEHRAVRDTAGHLLHLLEPSAGSCASPADRSSLRDHVEDFRRRLSVHFASEEFQWSGGRAGRTDRTTSVWIERLVREHRDFERRLDSVLSRLDPAGGASAPPPAEVVSAIRAILGQLLEHELTETRLFQRTVFEEAADFPGDPHSASPSG